MYSELNGAGADGRLVDLIDLMLDCREELPSGSKCSCCDALLQEARTDSQTGTQGWCKYACDRSWP